MQLCSSLNILWHCPSLELKWKVTFSSPVATAEFSKFVDLLNAAFSQHHLLGFSSTGIPSPPLALFIVMLPKAQLTSHSKVSGSRWLIIPSWLSGLWRSFLYISSVYSCHLFLISSASVRSIPFCHLLCPSLHEMFPWNISNFLDEISSFPVCYVPLFLCTDHWERLSFLLLLFFGALHSNGYIFPFLFCLLLLFFHSYL